MYYFFVIVQTANVLSQFINDFTIVAFYFVACRLEAPNIWLRKSSIRSSATIVITTTNDVICGPWALLPTFCCAVTRRSPAIADTIAAGNAGNLVEIAR